MRFHVAAMAALAGATVLWPISGLLVAVAAGVAVVRRSALTVGLVCFLAAGWLGTHALDGLDPPPAGVVDGWITLTSDPRPFGPVGVRAGAIWDGDRVEVTAHGPTAGRLDDALAGEQVRVQGMFRPAARADEWARWRHEVGTVSVERVRSVVPGSRITRIANRVRGLLSDGVAGLGRDDRAVFLGMVLGDDREQSAVVADDFRAAGLGHLLVVSGQNVAFVIAVLAPVLVRTRPGVRLLVLGGALGFFALLTRFEPSVLRAVVMAGVGVGAGVLGTPVDGRRALSAAVAVLLLIDPFLAHVLAFQLSVAATAGIVWLGGPLAERLPGPEVLRTAVATTTSAQLAVAPLLVLTFGPMPLAALPANLLAGPASGPIMMWGCTGGLVAGAAGDGVAAVIHAPTRLAVGWVRRVAASVAVAPAASLGVGSLAVLTVAVGMVVWRRGRWMGSAAAIGAGAVVTAAVLAVPSPAPGRTGFVGGSVWRLGGLTTVELDDPPGETQVLAGLRALGVRRVDAIVATDGDVADARVARALHLRYGSVLTLAPPDHRVPDARTVPVGERVAIGALEVTASTGGVGLVVGVTADR